jgi:NAD(P)-dependent dehydrogenase (short-subunit alcohol dehydrogenase family)
MSLSNNPMAMIVGGSSGIGYATAKQLLESGIATLIVGKNAEKLKRAANELSKYGKVESVQANLYLPTDVGRILAVADDHSRHFKYLVNAAGYFNPTPFLNHTEKDYEIYMGLNGRSFHLTGCGQKHESARGRLDCKHRFHVGQTGDQSHPSSAYSMASRNHALLSIWRWNWQTTTSG